VVVDAHHLRLRAERLESGRRRVYTITITCSCRTNKASRRLSGETTHIRGKNASYLTAR
jgi:hypothetical protein